MRISDWSSDVCSSDLWQAAQTALAWIVESSELERVLQQAVQVFGIAWHAEKFQKFESHKVYTDTERILTPELLVGADGANRSEEHTSELQSLMRISYAVFCLKKKKKTTVKTNKKQAMKKQKRQ